MDLTDEQWQLVEPLLLPLPPRGRGRPPHDGRAVLNGILWKLRTGEPWYNLPPAYPSHQTCYRYHRQWQRAGLLREVLARLEEDLRVRGGLDLQRAVREGAISLIHSASGWRFKFPPQYQQGTWQHSTALLFFALALQKLKKKEEMKRPQFSTG